MEEFCVGCTENANRYVLGLDDERYGLVDITTLTYFQTVLNQTLDIYFPYQGI